MPDSVSGLRGSNNTKASKWTDIFGFYLLLVAAITSVVLYGSVDAWAETIVLYLIFASGLIRGISVAVLGTGVFFPREYRLLLVPLILVLLVAGVQLIPFADGQPISLDTYATRRFIVVGAGILIFFEGLLSHVRSVARLKTLIIVLVIAGAGSALFGVARQVMDGSGWLPAAMTLEARVGYAQFINRNHFAFVIEMVLGLLCGLSLKGALIERFKFGIWVLNGLLIIVLITLNSRGGLMSGAGVLIMAGVLHLFLGRSHPRRASGGIVPVILKSLAVGLLVGAIAIFVIAFIGGDQVVSRIEKFSGEVKVSDTYTVQRGQIWKSTWDLIVERPVLGVGFGAYGMGITKFDKTGGNFSLRQAHNDYLELLANGGIISVVFVGWFLFEVFRRIASRLNVENGLGRGSSFGALLGVAGVLIHSSVEFGLHALGVALLFVILIVIGVADPVVTGLSVNSRR